ncbi:glycosyltransferase family 4 protein [Archangium lansingense]|uniref:Glycosyltransferase family 4 protein n=1 Tax=Archangium lansingense TaxID=2995310 RepID=A0ABT4A0H4_9BACT|nr:glycosyltransferase family 4 protein [Archangium lansinium]MCY1074484.1 glycosyltransferase family 4 protein [Archangium lansinium]
MQGGSTHTSSTALICGAAAGSGGLGGFAATVLRALSQAGTPLHVLGPPPADARLAALPGVVWHTPPRTLLAAVQRWTPYRWLTGALQLHHDEHLGKWTAARLEQLRPSRLYAFTQVGLESLEWARRTGVPCVVDNPNGHIAGFRDVYVRETWRQARRPHLGHPTSAAVRRIEREYTLASAIRVSSPWSRDSMVRRGVPAAKVTVLDQLIDVERFRPPATRPAAEGPLRVCFVGSMDVRKGFHYLLRAVRQVGAGRVQLHLVGATGDRVSRRLFEREREGLQLEAAPGDPRPVYQRSELFVLPTLEDGFGLVVGEAMASGLPVVVTDACGAAAWVEPGRTGWVIPAANEQALVATLEEAIRRRSELPRMGELARAAVEARMAADPQARLRTWFESVAP